MFITPCRAGIASLVLLWVSACAKAPPEHHDLAWYHAHLSERNDKAKWCGEDLARQDEPDCRNSMKAQELWGSIPEGQQKPNWQQGQTPVTAPARSE